MPEFFNFDPTYGVTEEFDFDPTTGKVMIHSTRNIDPFLKATAETRATGRASKGLMDNGREFHHYASLDTIVMLELRKKGIDIYSKDKSMMKRMFHEINTNYPHCIVDPKRRHWG